jgi:hypothetical protein
VQHRRRRTEAPPPHRRRAPRGSTYEAPGGLSSIEIRVSQQSSVWVVVYELVVLVIPRGASVHTTNKFAGRIMPFSASNA